MRRLLVALAATAAACATTERAPCPGAPAGTFSWEATRQPDSCRLEASPDAVSFRATLAFEGEAAALCLDRPQATPLTGTRTGGALSVSSREEGLAVQGCGCAVSVTETVDGTLRGEDPARPAGFDGALVERVEVAPGADLADCGCALPCEVRYALTAAP